MWVGSSRSCGFGKAVLNLPRPRTAQEQASTGHLLVVVIRRAEVEERSKA